MGALKFKDDYTFGGSEMALKVGKLLVEDMKEKGFEEALTFKEDNDMDNSSSWYTTKLATAIYYKAFDKFKQYFDMVWNLTPADVGSVDGAGIYKIPKVIGAPAAKVAGGEVVDYLNDGKGDATLETDTYAIGTRINRRLLKRAGKGVIDRLLTAASDSVLKAVCQDLINGMVSAADTDNTVTGEISYAKVEKAIQNIREAANDKSQPFGLEPDFIAFTPSGWYAYSTDTDVKAMIGYGQGNVPGQKLENQYKVIHSQLKVVNDKLITATKDSGKAVRAIVVDSMNFMCFLKETEMTTFDGRLPGTPGDMEVIHAMDAGFTAINTKGGSVITAAS